MRKARLPYRGEPEPKLPRPKRQVRNFSAEKRMTVKTISMWILLTVITLGVAIFSFYTDDNGYGSAIAIAVFLLTLTITVGVVNGLTSINKFRQGHDIDISDETKPEDTND